MVLVVMPSTFTLLDVLSVGDRSFRKGGVILKLYLYEASQVAGFLSQLLYFAPPTTFWKRHSRPEITLINDSFAFLWRLLNSQASQSLLTRSPQLSSSSDTTPTVAESSRAVLCSANTGLAVPRFHNLTS